jgi:hypothetical protein
MLLYRIFDMAVEEAAPWMTLLLCCNLPGLACARATTRFAVAPRPRFVKKVKQEGSVKPASTLALRRSAHYYIMCDTVWFRFVEQ